MSDHETTLRELAAGLLARGRIDAEEPSSASQRADIIRKSERNADACLAGADALRREVALRLVLKCAERACDADNMDAAVDYVREAIRQIAPTEPTR